MCGCGEVFKNPLPLVSHLFVDNGVFLVHGASGVLFDDAAEELVHHLGSAPATGLH
jgi:hypothetical protein